MLISIITTTYNAGNDLKKTIKSVLNQTYKEIEYIIIDGGSTDSTMEIVSSYKDKLTHFESKRDRGVYDGMNRGISCAKGELIGLLNAGDWYSKNAVKNMAKAHKNNPDADIFFGKVKRIYQNKSTTNSVELPIGWSKYFGPPGIPHPAFFFTKRLYKQQMYDIDYPITADYKFIMQALENDKKYIELDSTITHFPVGGISSAYKKPLVKGFLTKTRMSYERYRARKDIKIGSFFNIYRLCVDMTYAVFSLLKRSFFTTIGKTV